VRVSARVAVRVTVRVVTVDGAVRMGMEDVQGATKSYNI
jgi:hypothetical protein